LRSLWSQWPQIRHYLAAKNLILLFDFDGTLSPIAPRPSAAIFSAATRAALLALSRSPRVTLGFVSGRILGELRRLVRMKGVYLIGSHGWECMAPDQVYRLRASAETVRHARRIASQLRPALRGLPGIWIERKVVSVTVHYRGAGARSARAARALVLRIARRHASRFHLLHGKKTFEFLPLGDINKGTAVRTLVARLRRRHLPVVVYAGDDASDETVFARLGKRDIGIHVGARKRSRAGFYLRSPRQVCRFLEHLSTIVL
jgi:trehalose-phosphatase